MFSHSFIFHTAYPTQGFRKPGAYPMWLWDQGGWTPKTMCQHILMHKRCQSDYNAYICSERGNQNTQKKPLKHKRTCQLMYLFLDICMGMRSLMQRRPVFYLALVLFLMFSMVFHTLHNVVCDTQKKKKIKYCIWKMHSGLSHTESLFLNRTLSPTSVQHWQGWISANCLLHCKKYERESATNIQLLKWLCSV